MNHTFYKVKSCKVIAPNTLELQFNDGLIKEINFEKILCGEMFSPLRNLDFFN